MSVVLQKFEDVYIADLHNLSKKSANRETEPADLANGKGMFPTNRFSSLFTSSDKGRLVAVTLLTSLFTIMPVGYHMVVLNVPEKVIQKSLNQSLYNAFGMSLSSGGMSILWSTIVSSQAFGALIGCFLVLPIQQKYGAKTGMMSVNNIILVTGSVLMFLAFFMNFAPFLILGRIVTGMYTGIACALVPLFVQQIAPKNIKGSLSCFMHIAVCFGSSVGAIFSLDFMLGNEAAWGVMLALPALLGCAQIIVSFFIPDTPNHLLQNGHYRQAVKAIQFYYDIDEEEEEEAIKQYWDMVPEVPEQTSILEVISSRSTQKGILLGMAVSATQVFSGSMATISYSSSMFAAVSFSDVLVPFLPAIGSIVSMILTVPAIQLVETSGRRSLLLKTLVICIVADTLLLIFSLLSTNGDDLWASWLFAVAFFLYGVGYNLGTGPVAYFLPAELVPAYASAASLGAAVAVNWICSLFTTLTYYPLSLAIGGWSYLLFILPTTVLTVILWLYLPETRGMTPVDPVNERMLQDLGRPYGTFESTTSL